MDSVHTLEPCSTSFTDVQLVKYPVPCREKELFDLAAIMRKGLAQNKGMQSSSESHVTIDNSSFTRIKSIFDVLKPNYNSEEYKPEVIMIEGAPGMGKTTLCKEIAYQWAQNHQSLTYLKLVLFISLEDVVRDKIKALEDLLLYFYNFDKTADDFAKQCAGILQQRNNHDILVIVDGYDINHDSTKDSFLTQIVKRKVLKECKIIITPRDVCTSVLQNFVDIRIEILGFSDEKKKEYIENEFKNYPNKIEELSSYLGKCNNINGICYLPMVMDVLVQTYKETEELPDDQTELYQKIICHLIIRCMQKHGEVRFFRSSNLLLQNLPDVCDSYLLNLSEIAFNFLKSGKAIFTDIDFKMVNPSIIQNHNIPGLGLLKSTQHLQADNMNVCFFHNFLHSSIQEFLAAYYVTSQKASSQFELLKSTFFINEYTNVWIVFVSLYKHAFSRFSNYLTYYRTPHALECLIGELKELDILHSFPKLIKECVFSVNHEMLQILSFRAAETKYYNTLCLTLKPA